MNNFNNFLRNILAALSGLFGSKSSQTQMSADPAPATVVSPRVLVIVIDPVVDPASGETLNQRMRWNRPEDLIAAFLADISSVSGGLARYQIVQRVEVSDFPVKADGFRYTPETYLNVLQGNPAHEPDLINYQDFLDRHQILQLVSSNQIDEVWAFGFPYNGFYESTMGGPGAFFCNSNPIPNTSSSRRRFVIMGFSNERGVGEMLHSFGHRAESIMQQVYLRTTGSANLWQRFTRYDQISPGHAEVGTVHFPPNGQRDYDYTNQRIVPSHCDDWYNFPNFTGAVKQVNNAEWGSDIYSYTMWWLKHLPKVDGRTNGIAHNWWQYILDPNRVAV